MFAEHWDEMNTLQVFQQMGAAAARRRLRGRGMTLLSQLAALAAIVGTGVVYGTDVFCALVQRPALARVDDATLTAVMGNVHRSQTAACPLRDPRCRRSRRSRRPRRSSRPDRGSGDGGSAFLLLVGGLVLYLRISAPINRTLTAAADAHETPLNAHALQRDWDRIIVPRAVLQGLAVVALCVSLIG